MNNILYIFIYVYNILKGVYKYVVHALEWLNCILEYICTVSVYTLWYIFLLVCSHNFGLYRYKPVANIDIYIYNNPF